MKKYEIYLLYERCYDILFIINIGVEKDITKSTIELRAWR